MMTLSTFGCVLGFPGIGFGPLKEGGDQGDEEQEWQGDSPRGCEEEEEVGGDFQQLHGEGSPGRDSGDASFNYPLMLSVSTLKILIISRMEALNGCRTVDNVNKSPENSGMSVSKKPGGGRKKPAENSYHHGDLRRALLDAAMQLVTAQGVKGFTLREAAREAGVSHNAPYRHFASRADILVALATEGQQRLLAKMEGAVAKAPSQRQRLERLAVAYLEFAAMETPLFRVMFSADVNEAQTPELAKAQAATMACFEREVRAGEECGLLQAGKADTFLLAGWSAMHGGATLLIDRVLGRTSGLSQRAPKRIAGDLMATLFEGMLRHPAG